MIEEKDSKKTGEAKTDQLAKEQMTQESEMQQIPTEGKKPGEIENFKESVRNNNENEEKLKDQK